MTTVDETPAEAEDSAIQEPTYYSLEGALEAIRNGDGRAVELLSADSDLRLVLGDSDVQRLATSIRHHAQCPEILELLADHLGENAAVLDGVEHSYLYGRAKALTSEGQGIPGHLQEMLGLPKDSTAHDIYSVLARISPEDNVIDIAHDESAKDTTVLDKKSGITSHDYIRVLREQNPERFSAVIAVSEEIMRRRSKISIGSLPSSSPLVK